MTDISLAPGNILFYFFAVLVLVFLVQQVFYWIFFSRLAFYKFPSFKSASAGISVVICARNEYGNLKKNLPMILDQDHPEFEVIVVNWASDDESSALLGEMSNNYPRLKIVEIKENLNFFSGKKFPLSIGIKSARNEIIVVTEASCRPVSRNWLTLMGSQFTGTTEVVLGYGAFEKKKGVLNRLVRFDAFHTACRYLAGALAGVPYMGVGRNMAYLRSLFIRNRGFISHYRLHSGEDDLFINQVARKDNTRALLNPEGFTVSEQEQTFRNWMVMKRNLARTRRLYRAPHKILFGAYSIVNILFYLFFIILAAMNYNLVLIIPLFLLKIVVQVFLFSRCMAKLNEKDLVWFVPFYELALTGIDTFVFLGSLLIRKNRWK